MQSRKNREFPDDFPLSPILFISDKVLLRQTKITKGEAI